MLKFHKIQIVFKFEWDLACSDWIVQGTYNTHTDMIEFFSVSFYFFGVSITYLHAQSPQKFSTLAINIAILLVLKVLVGFSQVILTIFSSNQNEDFEKVHCDRYTLTVKQRTLDTTFSVEKKKCAECQVHPRNRRCTGLTSIFGKMNEWGLPKTTHNYTWPRFILYIYILHSFL